MSQYTGVFTVVSGPSLFTTARSRVLLFTIKTSHFFKTSPLAAESLSCPKYVILHYIIGQETNMHGSGKDL